MDKLRSMALQAAKEITVKFIESGRISPTNFSEFFAPIYNEILATIARDLPEQESDGGQQAGAGR
ncbi:MAG: hypothetical protein ACOCVM_09555 [Desulfovibrionaceae bacterium]